MNTMSHDGVRAKASTPSICFFNQREEKNTIGFFATLESARPVPSGRVVE